MSGSNEYISDSSDYVSSVINENTPFPSLTKSEKSKIDNILHKGKVSTYEHMEGPVEPSTDVKPVDESLTECKARDSSSLKNSCCCLC